MEQNQLNKEKKVPSMPAVFGGFVYWALPIYKALLVAFSCISAIERVYENRSAKRSNFRYSFLRIYFGMIAIWKGVYIVCYVIN